MSQKKAFPSKKLNQYASRSSTKNVYSDEEEGMDMLDYHAGKALAGLTANPDLSLSNKHYAENAYKIAGEMEGAKAKYLKSLEPKEETKE